MTKKAQLLSQPFTIIFSLVVIAMIISFGGYLIYRLMQTESKVDIARFNIEFKKKVTEIALLSPGSGDMLDVYVPNGVKGVCFVDMGQAGFDSNKIIYSEIKERVDGDLEAAKKDRNMYFAVASKEYPPINPVTVPKLKPSPNPLCIDVLGGRLKAGLENKGNYVEVSKS